MSLRNLEIFIRNRAKIPQFFRDVCNEVSHRVILRTPVDTGNARRNWTREFDGNQSFTLYNPLDKTPYIRRLEYDGWSQQAPQGMVRITAAEFGDIVEFIANKYR